MKRIGFLAACTVLLLGLAGCGGGEVDETLLPTRIPTLGPEDFVVVVAPSPTATNEPAPTEEPAVAGNEVDSETPEGEPTAADETATPIPRATIDYGLEITGTVEMEETPEETPPPAEPKADTDIISASEEITGTGEVQPEETPLSAEPEEDADTISTSEEITGTGAIQPEETPLSAEPEEDADTISASEEISGTGEVQPEVSGQEITSTLELTATETSESEADASDTEVMTNTTGSGSVLPTATPDPAADEQSEAAEPANEESPQSETTTPEPDAETDEGASTGNSAPVDPSLPESIAVALADADMDNGETLTLSNGCIACHSLDASQPMPGPTWANVANTAATRVEGQESEAYLYHSIINPNEYITEGFQPNIMLQIYGDTLSEQDIADIIAYLLTLTSAN